MDLECRPSKPMLDTKNFNRIMKQRNADFKSIASHLKLSPQQFNDYASGRTDAPLSMIKTLADYLKCRTIALLDVTKGKTFRAHLEPRDVAGSLLRNSTGFVRKALSTIATTTNDPTRIKFACIEMYAAVELLLKATLAQEHWTLIIARHHSLKELYSGEVQTLDFETAITRIRDVQGLRLDEDDLKAFGTLRQLRNRYMHFSELTSTGVVRLIVLEAWRALLNFYHTVYPRYADKRWWFDLQEAASNLPYREQAIQGFTEALVKEQLNQNRVVWDCYLCRFEVCVLGDGLPHCELCNHTYESDDYINRYLSAQSTDVADLRACTECGQDAVVPLLPELARRLLAREFSNQLPPDLSEMCDSSPGCPTVCLQCLDVDGKWRQEALYLNELDDDDDRQWGREDEEWEGNSEEGEDD